MDISRTDIPVCPCFSHSWVSDKEDFPYLIFHLSFFIEEGSPKMTANEKCEMENGKSGFGARGTVK